MSSRNSSLAVEVKDEVMEPEVDLCLHTKHLSISDVSAELDSQVIKVRGTITVSF